jgi:hypothetical protein
MERQLGRAGERNYRVRVDMTDPAVRAQVLRDIETLTADWEHYPGGAEARRRLLDAMASLDELTLVQSPRATGGENLARTTQLREDFTKAVARGELLDDEYRQAFDETRRRGEWPHTPDGRPWELDHIIELWQSGRDDLTNIVALDPRLHALKTRAMEIFRRKYRDANIIEGEQTEPRELDLD